MSLPERDAKEIEDIIGSIKQNFECPICIELMLNPVSTKCDHKFCRHCILEVISRKPSAPCPLCKVSVTKRSLQDLVEWKNLVGKVKRLIEAFKLDLAEELVTQEGRESATEAEVPIPLPETPSAFHEQQETLSRTHDVKRRRSVRFKLDGDCVNSRKDEGAQVEPISNDPYSNNGCVKSMKSVEILSTTEKTRSAVSDTLSMTNKTNSVTSDTPLSTNKTKSVVSDTPLLTNKTKSVTSDTPSVPNKTKSVTSDTPSVPNKTKSVTSDIPLSTNKTKSVVSDTSSVTNKTKSVTSDTPHGTVSRRTECLRNESIEAGIENNSATKLSITGVESSSSSSGEEDGNHRGLITGGYQADVDLDVEMRPLAENRKIFKSRVLSREVKPDFEKSKGVQSTDDPYAFVGSQPTPKRKKMSVQKPLKDVHGIHMFEDFSVLPKRRKRMSLGKETPGHRLPAVKKKIIEVANEQTGREYDNEIQALSDKFTDAETYNLVLSQQFRNGDVENKRNQKHDKRSGMTKNLVPACNKTLPLASAENRKQMKKIGSILMQKDDEVVEAVPLTASKTVQPSSLNRVVVNEPSANHSVPKKIVPNEPLANHSVPQITVPNEPSGNHSSLIKTVPNEPLANHSVPKITAPRSSVSKINEIESNESVSSKVPYKSVSNEALQKEAVTKEVAPNKLTLNKTVLNEVLPRNMEPEESVPIRRKTGTSPNTDVNFQVHISGSNEGTCNEVGETNESQPSDCTGLEGGDVCSKEQDGDVSVVYRRRSSKRRKCSELVEEATDLALTSRDRRSTRSNSRRRNQFQTVETKWQKKYQRNVAAKEECRRAIEEFDKLQDVPTSSLCATSITSSGLNQSKRSVNTENIALPENVPVPCLEEKKVVEERRTGKESILRAEPTKEQDNGLEEQSKATIIVESSSQSSITCVPDSVEEQLEENSCTEKTSGTAEGKSVTNTLRTCTENVNETSEYKEKLTSDRLFSENPRSDDGPLPFAQTVVMLGDSRAGGESVLVQGRWCKDVVAEPDDMMPKLKGKRKASSLEADLPAAEEALSISENTLSEHLRTTDSISAEESQCRESMAAPIDFPVKPKAKRKRKTFSLEPTPTVDEKMNRYSLATDSIDIDQLIGEAVLGMLDKTGASGSAEDDLSTQEIEMHEAVWKSGWTAKGNGLDRGINIDTHVVGSSQFVPALMKSGTILVRETESGSTGVEDEEIENERRSHRVITGDMVNCVEAGKRDRRDLALDDSSEFVEARSECVRISIESSCAEAESRADGKLEDILIGADESSSVHSNSYSLLQPTVPVMLEMSQNKSCTDMHLKDSSVNVRHSSNRSPIKHLDSCRTEVETQSGAVSENLIESDGLTVSKFDELNVNGEAKSLSDLTSLSANRMDREVTPDAATCLLSDLKSKMVGHPVNQSELQKELNLVMESVTPHADRDLGSDFKSVNEQNSNTESSDIRKSLESIVLSSACETTCHAEGIRAESAQCVVQDAKKIEEPVTLVNESDRNESDDSEDEIVSPVSRANLTSSINLSSESEMLTTQQRHDLEVEVKTMEEEIARLQAELTDDVKTTNDRSDGVPIVAPEKRDSELEAIKPHLPLPASSEQNGNKPSDRETTFVEGVVRDNPDSDGVRIVLDFPNDQTADCKVDDLETELKQFQSEDVEESCSEADLFGSQMSDIVAIPQTPTPTKNRTPRAQFSRLATERDIERKDTPKFPTPPPPIVITQKKEKMSSNDLEYVNETKRDHRAVSYENCQQGNRNLGNDESKTCLKSVEQQGSYSRKASDNLDLEGEEIVTHRKTPENKRCFVATTYKRCKSAVSASSSMPRDCATQPLKEKQRHGSPFSQKKNWILVASGINRASEMPLVEEFVQRLGCRFLQKFTNGTTHVLVKPVKEGSRRCQRTLKYFQGIAHRSWVVSIEWVIDSIRMGCLQSEDKYEITGDVAVNEDHFGPTNARLSGVQLLRKFEICCLGAFDDLTRDDLRGLAEACGASSLQDPAMFSFDVDRTQVIIVEIGSRDTGLQHFKKLYKKFSVPIVAKEWLLDSVGTYDVKSPDEYAVYPPLPSQDSTR